MVNKIARILIIIMLIMVIPYNVFAAEEDGYQGVDTNVQIGNTDAVNSSAEITGRIVGVFQVAGTVISVIALIIIGIRYMVSSTEGKAEMKGVLVYYVIGAILVFATSNVLAWGYEIVDSVQHTWDSGKITKPPTCVGKGIITYTCTICDKTRTEEIEKTGTHIWDGGKVTRVATCAVTGIKTYTCTYECGTTKTETIARETTHTWNSGSITTPATCISTGTRTYTCTVTGCNATKTETIAKKTTHTWNSGSITTPATCKNTGIRTYRCTVCRKTKTETIAKTDHLWNNGKVTTPATCAATGKMLYTCTVCGATDEENIAKTNTHTWNSGSVTTQATCAATGVRTYTCTVTGCTGSKEETIAKTTSHSYDSGKIKKKSPEDNYYHKVERSCTVCGTGDSYDEKHSMTGTWVFGLNECTECGEQRWWD